MRRRRGFSLVEVVTVMGGIAMILSLSATLLTRAMRSQSESRRFFETEQHALLLGETFRHDVHRARSSEVEPSELGKDELLQLTLGEGQTATYQRTADGLLRVLSKDGKPAAREEYRLGAGIDVALRREGSPERLILSITEPENAKPPGPDDPPVNVRELPASMEIEAALGRDLRFAGDSAKSANDGGSP
jgi:type II secretory pathway pseudopilin PulG